MKTNQRKIGAVLSYVSIAANTLIQLLYTPFLIRKLGQSEYGLFSLVSSIIGYLTVLDLGFGNAIIVHSAKYRAKGETEKERKLHGMFHVIYIVIGIIAGIAGVTLALCSDEIFGEKMTPDELHKMRIMLYMLSFNLFITFAFSIYNSIITANEEFVFQKLLAVINTIAKPLLMIPLLFLGFKSIALCAVITVVNIAVLFTNYLFCKKKLGLRIKFQGFDKKLFKTIFAYSFWIFLTQIVDKINWSADQFILGAVSGTIAVSVYSAASTLNTLFINLSTAISGVMLPKVSKMVAGGASSGELTKEWIKVGRIQFLIVFMMACGLVLAGKQFIKIWLGESFDDSYYVALLLILPAVLSLIQSLGLAIMQAMDKFRFKALSTFVMAIFNIVLSVVLAQKYGAPGAAFGTTISIILCNVIVMNIYYWKAIRLDVFSFWKNILAMAVKLLIPFVLTIVIEKVISLEGIRALLVYGFIYAVSYAAIAYMITMNNYEKAFVNKLVFKVIKRR